MAHTTEVKFGDLQTDERFKKLERTLKLASLRKGMEGREMWPTATSCSVSSINADAFDSSSTIPSLQTSRIGSEVVASSNNLRNILLKKEDARTNHKAIATSSVKQYHAKASDVQDRLVMPPPCFSNIPYSSKQLKNNALHNLKKSVPLMECNTAASMAENSAPTGIYSYGFSNSDSNKACRDSAVLLQTFSNDAQSKKTRVFSRWRVMLNSQGQLIIKGTLECGKVARSKPVIRRLTATSVESIFKHLYHLQGTIVDDRNELPDYVRGKFYNGFPDDWENVYQIWRTFMQKGCPPTFRWPTPITDSDDDLRSEITDITFSCTKNNETKSSTLELYKATNTPNRSKHSPQEKKGKEHRSSHNVESNDTFTQTYISGTDEIIYSNAKPNDSHYHESSNKENCMQQENMNNSQVSTHESNKLKDILREDKLNIIINNLADKNCSREYINKIIEMFDCLNYAVSYRSSTDVDSNMEESRTHCSRSAIGHSSTTPQSYSTSDEIPIQKDIKYTKQDNGTIERMAYTAANTSKNREPQRAIEADSLNTCDSYHNKPAKKRNIREVETDGSSSTDNSESETYAGVPRIPGRVLQQNGLLIRRCKRKVRKKTMHSELQKSNAVEAQYKLRTALSSDYVETPVLKNNHFNPDDTSVSITEDENDLSRVKKFVKLPLPDSKSKADPRINIGSTSIGVTLQNNLHNPSPDLFETNLYVQNEEYDVESQTPRLAHSEKPDLFKRDKAINELQNHKARVAQVDLRIKNKLFKNTVYDRTGAIDIEDNVKRNDQSSFVDRNSHGKVFNEGNESTPYQRKYVSRELSKEPVAQSKHVTSTIKPTVVSSLSTNLNVKHFIRDSKLQPPIDSDVSVIQDEDKNDHEDRSERPSEKSLENSLAPKTTSHSKLRRDIVQDSKVSPDSANPNISKAVAQDVTKSTKSNKFGIESNPKQLSSWVPRVVHHADSNNELGLVFEGKLLNEAGHVVHKKFTTDVVGRRISPTLIETIDHEYYQLVGDLNDTKHVVPKELLTQCRYGCPQRVENFCKMWKSLGAEENPKSANDSHDSPVGILNVPVSSKGRRIVPPLNYWIGERIALKDNNPVYDPGNSRESLMSSSYESPQNRSNAEKSENARSQSRSTKKQAKSAYRENNSDDLEAVAAADHAKVRSEDLISDKPGSEQKRNRQKKSMTKQRQTTQQLLASSDSSDSKKSPVHKKQRVRAGQRQSSNSIEQRNKGNVQGSGVINTHGLGSNAGTPRSKSRSTKSGQKGSTSSPEDSSKVMSESYEDAAEKHNLDIQWTYRQDVPLRDDTLSDDQVSHI